MIGEIYNFKIGDWLLVLVIGYWIGDWLLGIGLLGA
jgi:hypothetical protein